LIFGHNFPPEELDETIQLNGKCISAALTLIEWVPNLQREKFGLLVDFVGKNLTEED